MALYRDEFGSLKYINLFFKTYDDCYQWCLKSLHRNDFLVVTAEEFFAFRDKFIDGYNSEVSYWSSRIPRPVQREIIEVVEEPDFREITPKVNYTNLTPRRQSLFKPYFAGQKRRPQDIEDGENDDYYSETVTQNR